MVAWSGTQKEKAAGSGMRILGWRHVDGLLGVDMKCEDFCITR